MFTTYLLTVGYYGENDHILYLLLTFFFFFYNKVKKYSP